MPPRRRWLPEEDRVLMERIARYRGAKGFTWKALAPRVLPERSWQECKTRYFYLRGTPDGCARRRRNWTREECDTLMETYQHLIIIGVKDLWKELGKIVGRNPLSCKRKVEQLHS